MAFSVQAFVQAPASALANELLRLISAQFAF
jgi:hypothetical protein